MAKKEDKKGARGRTKALKQIAQTGGSGLMYREWKDYDTKDVIDVKSFTQRGTGYSQDSGDATTFGNQLHASRATDPKTGNRLGTTGIFKHKGKLYSYSKSGSDAGVSTEIVM